MTKYVKKLQEKEITVYLINILYKIMKRNIFYLSLTKINKLCKNSICSRDRSESVWIEGGSGHSLERSHDSRDLLDFERRSRSLHDLQGVLSVLQNSGPRCSGRLGSRCLRHLQLHPRGWKSELWDLLLESPSLRHA